MTVSFDQIKIIELLKQNCAMYLHIIPRTHQKKLFQKIGLVFILKTCKCSSAFVPNLYIVIPF